MLRFLDGLAIGEHLHDAVVVAEHFHHLYILKAELLEPRHTLTERETLKGILRRMVVMVHHHLLGMHSIYIKEYLPAGFHSGACLRKLLYHITRFDIIAVNGITDIHTEALVMKKPDSLGIPHVLDTGHSAVLSVASEYGNREIGYAKPEDSHNRYDHDIGDDRMGHERPFQSGCLFIVRISQTFKYLYIELQRFAEATERNTTSTSSTPDRAHFRKHTQDKAFQASKLIKKILTKRVRKDFFINFATQSDKQEMRKYLLLLPLLAIMGSCGEYNKVLKSRDVEYKFDYAKRAFNDRKFTQAATVLTDIIVPLRGGPNGEEALFLLGMSYFENKDYLNSGINFKTYYSRYPKGKFAELARFYSGYGYYLDSPDSQLDQSTTVRAIEELQGFLDYFPESDKVSIAQNAIFEMQDKLTLKELQNAQLYYNLGNFRGNNYQSAIITAQNALKTYPYSKYREDFELLILKSKYQEAKLSIDEKKSERYNDVIDEYFSYINNYPDSRNRSEADNIYDIARKHVKN